MQRSPTTPGYFSPEAYLSPGVKRFSSPESSPRSEEEKKSGTHSLSGRFPSVSLFKEYQNAAMAVNFFSVIFVGSYSFLAASSFFWRLIIYVDCHIYITGKFCC